VRCKSSTAIGSLSRAELSPHPCVAPSTDPWPGRPTKRKWPFEACSSSASMLVVITASPYQPDSLRFIPIPPIVPARFPSCCSTLQQSGQLPALVLRAKRASGTQALTCVRTAREAPGARVTAALITSSPDAGAKRRQWQAAAQAS
jgi:hypothetical protein